MGQRADSFHERFEVQHRSASENGDFSARGDFAHGLECVLPKLRSRIALRRIDKVDEMMRRTAKRCGIGLGGADVHVAIH